MHLYKLLLPVTVGLLSLGCSYERPAVTSTPTSIPTSTPIPPPKLIINFEKPVDWVCLRDKFNAYQQENPWAGLYHTTFYSRHDDADNIYSVAMFPYPRQDPEKDIRQLAAQCLALTPHISD